MLQFLSQTHKSPDDAMLTITLHQVQHLAQYLVTTIVKLICYQTEVARGREMSAVEESLASYDYGASKTGVNT